MSEITHQLDPETGYYRQIVTPQLLRDILDANGDTHEPPRDFCDEDEWEVAEKD